VAEKAWIPFKETVVIDLYKCPICGQTADRPWSHCPTCKTKLTGGPF